MRRDPYGFQLTSCRRYERRIDERHAGDTGVAVAVVVLAVVVGVAMWMGVV